MKEVKHVRKRFEKVNFLSTNKRQFQYFSKYGFLGLSRKLSMVEIMIFGFKIKFGVLWCIVCLNWLK